MATREVTVESIAAGGDGVARADGLVVFVPRSAPGDVGVVDIEPHGRFARTEFRELRIASPRRIEPPCRHYVVDRCGGCQLQHLAYETQLEQKSRIIRDALVRIGRRELELPRVRPSPEPWRYRRKLTLVLRRRAEGWLAGLHPFDDPSRIFALRDCPITDARVVATWREILDAAGHFPDSPELRGAVRLDVDGPSFTLEGGYSWPRSSAFFDAVPPLRALWWSPNRSRRRLLHERRPGGAPGASFAQVNPAVAGELSRFSLERVRAHAPRTVIDGYSGLGHAAVALGSEGVQVTAVELDADAAAWCAARLPAGSRSIAARVEDVLGDLLPADVVLLNPPRAGLDARVSALLNAADPPPRAVVYVSCNPATLARDTARMPRFRVATVEGFDMFPQTAHVEAVCELVPEGA